MAEKQNLLSSLTKESAKRHKRTIEDVLAETLKQIPPDVQKKVEDVAFRITTTDTLKAEGFEVDRTTLDEDGSRTITKLSPSFLLPSSIGINTIFILMDVLLEMTTTEEELKAWTKKFVLFGIGRYLKIDHTRLVKLIA